MRNHFTSLFQKRVDYLNNFFNILICQTHMQKHCNQMLANFMCNGTCTLRILIYTLLCIITIMNTAICTFCRHFIQNIFTVFYNQLIQVISTSIGKVSNNNLESRIVFKTFILHSSTLYRSTAHHRWCQSSLYYSFQTPVP